MSEGNDETSVSRRYTIFRIKKNITKHSKILTELNTLFPNAFLIIQSNGRLENFQHKIQEIIQKLTKISIVQHQLIYQPERISFIQMEGYEKFISLPTSSTSISQNQNENSNSQDKLLLNKKWRQFMTKTPQMQYKYLIRPNIIIDFDLIRKGNYQLDSLDLRQYRSLSRVTYHKFLDMIEVETEIRSSAFRNFKFICDMLDSMNDNQAHCLSIFLKEYNSALDYCDSVISAKTSKVKNTSNSKNIANQQYITQNKCANQPTSHTFEILNYQINSNPQTNNFKNSQQGKKNQKMKGQNKQWTFLDSWKKAYNIIQQIKEQTPIDSRHFQYQILKGSESTSELWRHFYPREFLNIVLGSRSVEEMTYLILHRGFVTKSKDLSLFDTVKLSKEHHLYDATLSDLDKCSKTEQICIRQETPSDQSFQTQIEFQKIQLSNYNHMYNDFLLIIKPKQYSNEFLYNLVLSPNNTFKTQTLQPYKHYNSSQLQEPPQSEFIDVVYQAQTECFMEKFYPTNIQR